MEKIMKKRSRLIALLMVFMMVFTMMPGMAWADEAEILKDVSSDKYITVSIEAYGTDGNGIVLMRPIQKLKRQYINDDVVDALREAYGANEYVHYESEDIEGVSLYHITKVRDDNQADGFLDNGDYGEHSKWTVYINNQPWNGRRYVPAYYLKGGDVVRLIFTANDGQVPTSVNKDELIRTIGEYADSIWYESDTGYSELQAALGVLTDLDTNSAAVETARENLLKAFKATSIDIIQGDTLKLGENKSAVLSANVLPKNTSDTIVWSTSDSSIVSIDPSSGAITGVAEGTAVVTVTAGSVSDSITITVGKIPAVEVSITNGDCVDVEQRYSVQLEANILPENTTDEVQWSSADETIAKVDNTGKVQALKVGSTTVTAAAGSVTDTITVNVTETTSPYVYFKYADGRVQEMIDDTFTLSPLDEGKFIVGNYSGTVKWSCSDTGSDGSGGYEYRYWINSNGDYNPFEVKSMPASVSADGYSKNFTIHTVSSGITEIKVFVGDKEVNRETPFEVTGIASGMPVAVKGLKAGQWVNVPVQAFDAVSTDSTGMIRIYDGKLDMNAEGRATITVFMIDNHDVCADFDAVCGSVPLTAIDVKAPASYAIDKWDSQGNCYIGIIHGYENSTKEYHVVYTPSNATNQNLIWEDLTPEIAEFKETHSAGIVPKKAGTAKFKVYSESNPEVYDEVEVVFAYKTPLTSAECEKKFEMEAGDSVELDITMTPTNATEQRFAWSYSKDGIVRVSESVTADTYNRYITRRIIALSGGVVTVTGTPLDSTADCEPVVFEVKVGSGTEETIDYLKMAKDDIAHGLSYLKDTLKAEYGNEWSIFTILRSGETISEANIEEYITSVEHEIKNYSGSLLPTDYARLILTLPLLGYNPTDFQGYDLVEALYNYKGLDELTSNQISWALMALDSHEYDIPENAKWSRAVFIDKLLAFQAVDGSFGLGSADSGSADMTAMVLQALVPYCTDDYPAVKTAFDKALSYLKDNLTANVGYVAEGDENGCTAAQVLTALTMAKIDPVSPANGFTLGSKSLITNLDSFKRESGFAYLPKGNVNMMGTQQITYAMEAYRRCAEGENALYDLTDVQLPEKPSDSAEVPITVTVNGEAAEVISLGEREYLSSSWKDPYTKPIYTVKLQEGTDFVIGQIGNGDGASGANRVFAMANGMSMDGAYPYTMSASALNSNYILSTEEFTERVGDDTGLDTSKKLAFIEVKDSNYERLYVLLVELSPSETDEPGSNEGNPDITAPIAAELQDGTALTVTVNGTQTVNGKDVTVLEIAIPAGTSYVKVIPSGNYKVYDCDGYWEEDASNLSVIPMFGDFYTLTADGGRTIDYVIKFSEAKADPEQPSVTVPITVTVNGEAAEVTSLGEREYLSSSWKDPYTKPIYTVKLQEGTDFVIRQTGNGDGASGVNRIFAMADGMSFDGAYPYTMSASALNSYYILTADEFTERVGDDTGLDTSKKLAFIEVKDSNYERLYVLLVELTPAPVTYTVTLPSGTGYTVSAAEGSVSPVDPGEDYSFRLSVNESFEKGEAFAVKANGVALTEENGVYTIKNIAEDITVTVEGVVGKPTTENLTVIAGNKECAVTNTGMTSYKQSIYGTVNNVPVYRTAVPVDTDFIVNWNFSNDGAAHDQNYRYVFAIDGGGDMGAKYYPFTMHTDNIEDYVLTPAQVKEYFGLDIKNNAVFLEVYGSENIEGKLNPIYGLLVELISDESEVKPDVPPVTPAEKKVTLTLLGDHVHTAGEAEVHTLKDNNLEVWISSAEFTISDGTTVKDILEKAAAKYGLKIGNPTGNYVKYIEKNGVRLGEFTNGKLSGWMYTLNGVHPNLGVAEQILSDGDIIVFHYTDDYTKEKSGSAVGANPENSPKEEVVTSSGAAGSTEPVTTTTPTEVKVTGSTATATITKENVTETIKQAAENKSAEIVVQVSSSDTKGAANVKVQLDTTTVKDVVNKTEAVLTVKTENTTVTLDRETLKTVVAEAAGSTVTLEVIEVAAPTAVYKEAAGENGHVIQLVIKSGNKIISLFNEGKVTVTVEIPGKLADKRVAAIHIGDDGKVEHLKGQEVTVGGKKHYRFDTPHFSAFALVDADEIGLEVEEQMTADEVKALIADLTPIVRSVKTPNKNTKVTLKLDKADKAIIEELEAAGYTVKYNFYRSTKKSSKYKSMLIKDGKTYTNTMGKKGTMYYYKARVQVYDAEGELIARTALKDCWYANRKWTN